MDPDSRIIVVTVFLALAAVVLLGRGITGFVVSQSCCFPPDCAPENICQNAAGNAVGFEPAVARESTASLYLGLVMLVAAVAVHFWLRKSS